MPKKRQSKGPTSKFSPQPLDEDMFFKLFDILHDGCMEGNWSATARVLGITHVTARAWSKKPPKGPWWNHILHIAISEIYQSMARSKHKKIRKRAEKVAGQLHKAELHKLLDYAQFNEVNNSTVQRDLLVLMHQREELTLQELKKPGNLGSYSARAIREAATQLGLIRTISGFGKDKQVTYRMPTEDDL